MYNFFIFLNSQLKAFTLFIKNCTAINKHNNLIFKNLHYEKAQF
jgi:hypothetical protein